MSGPDQDPLNSDRPSGCVLNLQSLIFPIKTSNRVDRSHDIVLTIKMSTFLLMPAVLSLSFLNFDCEKAVLQSSLVFYVHVGAED